MPPEPTPGLGKIAYDLTLQRSHATLPRTTTISQLFTWLKATTSIYFAQLWLDNNAELDFLSYTVLTLLEELIKPERDQKNHVCWMFSGILSSSLW